MADDTDRVSRLLAAGGWQPVEMTESERKAGLNAVFDCQYGLVGVILTEVAKTVLASWAESQVALAERRKQDPSGRSKDAYLLFLCDHIEDGDWAALEGVMDDTHECRKICVSVEGRSLEEALKDLPFLCVQPWNGGEHESLADTSSELEDAGLSARLLADLGRRSADAVLENLMAGKYKGRKDHGENQEDHA